MSVDAPRVKSSAVPSDPPASSSSPRGAVKILAADTKLTAEEWDLLKEALALKAEKECVLRAEEMLRAKGLFSSTIERKRKTPQRAARETRAHYLWMIGELLELEGDHNDEDILKYAVGALVSLRRFCQDGIFLDPRSVSSARHLQNRCSAPEVVTVLGAVAKGAALNWHQDLLTRASSEKVSDSREWISILRHVAGLAEINFCVSNERLAGKSTRGKKPHQFGEPVAVTVDGRAFLVSDEYRPEFAQWAGVPLKAAEKFRTASFAEVAITTTNQLLLAKNVVRQFWWACMPEEDLTLLQSDSIREYFSSDDLRDLECVQNSLVLSLVGEKCLLPDSVETFFGYLPARLPT